MRKLNQCAGIPMSARVGLIVLATAVGLMLTVVAVAAPTSPNFDASYKTGPQHARPDDVITYTIVAVNNGDLVQNVVLSDALPGGVVFAPGRCTYVDADYPDYPLNCDSLAPARMWQQNFPPGKHITTTFVVTVTADTPHSRLVNRAYLNWDGGQKEMVFTTTVLSAIPNFKDSYKISNPQEVMMGDVITYTIVAMNTGDTVTDVVLLDDLPGGVEFVLGSCTYDIGPDPQPSSLDLPCNSSFPTESQVWQEDLATGTHITTTFAATVTEDAAQGPLENCAYLNWDIIQKEMCFSTTVKTHIYLPLIMRQWVWWYQYDIYEPNNTRQQAYGPLVSNQVYEAYIWDELDKSDYYSITATSSNTIIVDLWNIPDGCDYDLYLYDTPTGPAPIASSNQYGSVDEHISYPSPTVGTIYYIRVYAYSDFNNQQPYRLKVIYQ